MRSIWDQSLRAMIGGGAGRGLVAEASSRLSISRCGDRWPTLEREWWDDSGFVWENGAYGLLVAMSFLRETGGRAVPVVREKRGASAQA